MRHLGGAWLLFARLALVHLAVTVGSVRSRTSGPDSQRALCTREPAVTYSHL